MDKDKLKSYIIEYLQNEVFATAREIGMQFDVTSQAASGSLRVLETRGILESKTIDAGMNSVKCYYLKRG